MQGFGGCLAWRHDFGPYLHGGVLLGLIRRHANVPTRLNGFDRGIVRDETRAEMLDEEKDEGAGAQEDAKICSLTACRDPKRHHL